MTDPQTTILETERLILRKLTIDDLDALFALYRDPQIRKYFPEGTLTYAETKEELEWIIDVYYGQYGFGLWATIYKATGAGQRQLHKRSPHSRTPAPPPG